MHRCNILKVKEFGMTDCWRLVDGNKRIGPVKTCRFDTRIDYVFVNEKFLKYWSLKSWKLLMIMHQIITWLLLHLKRGKIKFVVRS